MKKYKYDYEHMILILFSIINLIVFSSPSKFLPRTNIVVLELKSSIDTRIEPALRSIY